MIVLFSPSIMEILIVYYFYVFLFLDIFHKQNI